MFRAPPIFKTGIFILAAALLCSVAFAQTQPGKMPAAKPKSPVSVSSSAANQIFQFALANGMQVVVIPDHRAPVVTQMLWFKVGAVDDPPGVSGLAHFFEHMMFRGTPKVPDDQFSQIIAKNGGQE